MPITKSEKKSLRQTKKRALRNLQKKNTIKTLIKKTLKAVTGSDTNKVADLLRQTQKAIDKAVKSGVIKKNNANRKKSRLSVKVRKMMKS